MKLSLGLEQIARTHREPLDRSVRLFLGAEVFEVLDGPLMRNVPVDVVQNLAPPIERIRFVLAGLLPVHDRSQLVDCLAPDLVVSVNALTFIVSCSVTDPNRARSCSNSVTRSRLYSTSRQGRVSPPSH
jgi:hypothetical protein